MSAPAMEGWAALVERATDAATMSRAFARHVAAGARVTACRLVRHRDRPGRRCLAQWAVAVETRDGRQSEHRVTAQWRDSEEGTARRARKLSRRAAGTMGDWTAPLPPVFFDPELGMLATTYPWDRRLLALPRVASGADAAIVTPMLDDMYASVADLRACQVHMARYREQLGAVCRYTLRVADGVRGARVARYFVKVHADDRGAHAYDLLRSLAAATAGRGGVAQVDPPVTYLAPERALVLREAPGQPLDALLSDAPDVAALDVLLQRVAASVARFNQLAPHCPGLPARPDAGQALERSAATVARFVPELDARLAAIVASDAGTPPLLGVVHGDLKLEHIFVDGSNVRLVDLDSAHLGDPRWDLALLCARWWSATDASPAHASLSDWGTTAMTRAYRAASPQTWHTRVDVVCAHACVDVAAGLVKRREPDWRSRAARLVDRALTWLGPAS